MARIDGIFNRIQGILDAKLKELGPMVFDRDIDLIQKALGKTLTDIFREIGDIPHLLFLRLHDGSFVGMDIPNFPYGNRDKFLMSACTMAMKGFRACLIEEDKTNPLIFGGAIGAIFISSAYAAERRLDMPVQKKRSKNDLGEGKVKGSREVVQVTTFDLLTKTDESYLADMIRTGEKPTIGPWVKMENTKVNVLASGLAMGVTATQLDAEKDIPSDNGEPMFDGPSNEDKPHTIH